MEPDRPPKSWVVIVGIDFYLKTGEGDKTEPTKGAVNDAEAVKLELQKQLGTDPASTDYCVLTASMPDPAAAPAHQQQTQKRPPQAESTWPTHGNVCQSLRRVTDGARCGESLYLHYSGHGTARPAPGNALREVRTDVALVLFERRPRDAGAGGGEEKEEDTGVCGGELEMRYLSGQMLAYAIRSLVARGVAVTVVLDCCVSGGVFRGASGSRGVVRQAHFDERVAAASLGSELDVAPSFRHAKPDLDLFSDPDGYTIFCACGPGETAEEVDVVVAAGPQQPGRTEVRGALSYYLFKALRSLADKGVAASDITNQSLHECVRTWFYQHQPRQNPVRFGNVERSFFSGLSSPSSSPSQSATFALLPSKTSPGCVRMRAGRLHGVREGDEFAAYYPFSLPPGPDTAPLERDPGPLISLRAVAVRSFESELAPGAPGADISVIDIGWRARLVGSSSLIPPAERVYVQLGPGVAGGDWAAEAAARKHLGYLRLLPWRGGCTAESAEAGRNPPTPPQFRIEMSAGGEHYEIRDAHGRRVPKLPQTVAASNGSGSSGAVPATLQLLHHVVTYRRFRDLEIAQTSSPAALTDGDKAGRARAPPPIEQRFSLTFDTQPDELAGTSFHVKDRGLWTCTIRNLDDAGPLYVAIFCLSDSWGVENLSAAAGNGDHVILLPPTPTSGGALGEGQDTQRFRVRMEIPDRSYSSDDDSDGASCVDIIKLFVTNKPVEFPHRILPSLAKRSSPGQGRTARPVDYHQESGDLYSMLASMLSPSSSRRGAEDGDEDVAEWTTRAFVIHTSK